MCALCPLIILCWVCGNLDCLAADEVCAKFVPTVVLSTSDAKIRKKICLTLLCLGAIDIIDIIGIIDIVDCSFLSGKYWLCGESSTFGFEYSLVFGV